MMAEAAEVCRLQDHLERERAEEAKASRNRWPSRRAGGLPRHGLAVAARPDGSPGVGPRVSCASQVEALSARLRIGGSAASTLRHRMIKVGREVLSGRCGPGRG